MRMLAEAGKLMFFTGKGGVGKTSLACATAINLAEQGKRVLLVSTDPASNLDQVFGLTIGNREPTPIGAVTGLYALNIDPAAAAQGYRDRLINPVRSLLPEDAIRAMEEQLSGACTTEIAAFDEFTGLLTDEQVLSRFDHIIFDTAPTGHTLRLLQLPQAWSGFLTDNRSGTSCLGPLAGLEKQRQKYLQAVADLSNPLLTRIILVARAQSAALREAARTSLELKTLGIHNQRLILNGVFPPGESTDPLALAIRRREQAALADLPRELIDLPRETVWLQPRNMVGLPALRELLSCPNQKPFFPESLSRSSESQAVTLPAEHPTSLGPLIDELELTGHGLVMVLGKGGVGKTTVAAAIAVALAARGHQVHLTTTDPAAHLSMTVDSKEQLLQVDRIDPIAEREHYREHVLRTKGLGLDEAAKAILEEDLRSPCTEEIAVFQAFSRILLESRKKFVIVDTAPTGHTLLLLDATGAFHREVVRHLSPDSRVVTPLMRLQDPEQTKLIIVTLPEPTPVLESEELQIDLRRTGIEPWAWIINCSLAAAQPTDLLLSARAKQEFAQIEKVQSLAARLTILPLLETEPVGWDQLLRLS